MTGRLRAPLGALLAAALVVTDQKGDVVLEFPFSEALMAPNDTPTTRH